MLHELYARLVWVLLYAAPAVEAEPSLAEICEQAVKKAGKDFARGSMRFDSWGQLSSCSSDYRDLLFKWYGIHTQHNGCVMPDEPEGVWEARRCYRGEVDRLVFEKYGADAYERAWEEAGCGRELLDSDGPL
jgi:hypothetical protein